MQSYSNKQETYFSNARKDILPLMPAFAEVALEVGCGNGATLHYLKEQGFCRKTIGMEMHTAVADQAKEMLDEVIIGNAEILIKEQPKNSIDLILCLDVLEHTVEPWQFIDQAAQLLKPGGRIIASIPNIRTAVVLSKLLVKGTFDYHDGAGIMDRTHLRYFTRKSALALMNRAPMEVYKLLPAPNAKGSKSAIANALTLGLMRDFFTEQFLIGAQRYES